MKTILVALMLIASTAISVQAQKPRKTETVRIHTSAVCDMCKQTIESSLYKVKGVVSANLDVASKDVTVVFRTNKTNVDALRQAISKAGYDADGIAADKQSYDNLHSCCKKEPTEK